MKEQLAFKSIWVSPRKDFLVAWETWTSASFRILTRKLLVIFIDIDKVFREDLRYDKKYYKSKLTTKQDAALMMCYLHGQPIAFAMRYYDNNPKGFQANLDKKVWFADEMAVKKDFQNRGVGPTLMNLSFILGDMLGYEKMFLFCERFSDHGKNLFEYYKNLGFVPYLKDADGNAVEAGDHGYPFVINIDPEDAKRMLLHSIR